VLARVVRKRCSHTLERGYLSHALTTDKPERFHETLKARSNPLVFTSPEALQAAMGEFIEFYNDHRYHEGIGNLTLADVHYGRREEILERRKERKQETLARRVQYNLGPAPDLTRDEPGTGLQLGKNLDQSQKC
jgi:hypothetical protein